MSDEIDEIERKLSRKVLHKPPPRPSAAKVALLNVEYFSSNDRADDRCDDTGSQTSTQASGKQPPANQTQSRSKSPEVVTMMSQLRCTENESEHTNNKLSATGSSDNVDVDDNIRPGSRPGSPTKRLSANEKNYYELAVNGARDVTDRTASSKEESVTKTGIAGVSADVHQEPVTTEAVAPACVKTVMKTTKTLELLEDRNVREVKDVSTVTVQVSSFCYRLCICINSQITLLNEFF